MNSSATLRHVIKNMLVEDDHRNMIRDFIKESILLELGGGAEFDSNEEAAKKKWEASKALLFAWDDNNKKKLNLANKAKELGISIDTAKKRLKNDPKYAYDPKLAQKQRKTLEDDVEKAQREYARFEPSATGYVRPERDTNDSEEVNIGSSEKIVKKKKMMTWSSGHHAMTWTPWPKNIERYSGVKFGKQIEGERGESMGTGPGEKWLAAVFGGRVMGGGVSYDVEMPNGDKCESKELESRSSLIRPGTEGLAAFEKARSRLESVMGQMKEFIASIDMQRNKLESVMTDEEKRIVAYIRKFISDEYENIVGKGEISRDRIHYIRAVLKATKVLKGAHTSRETIKPTVTLNKKTVTVKRPTFIDIAKKIEKDAPEENILNDFEAWDIVLNSLKDHAFTEYTKFLDEWYEAVDPTEIFRQVNGVFIVNQHKGFFWIPQNKLKEALRFEVVSQGKPKFRFVLFDSGDNRQ